MVPKLIFRKLLASEVSKFASFQNVSKLFFVCLFVWLQCIRRLVEEKDKMNGLNALKYLSTILAVAARTIFETKRGTYWLTVAVTTSTIATLFNTYWDIFRDWGLMNRNSKNPWLRDKLLIPYKSIYFVAMVKARI